MKKKGFLQISFPWLFAIIVGIFILFLAIYAVTKLIRTEQTIQDVKTSKEIGILLNPLETGFEEAKITSLGFPVETRIFNTCNLEGEFGRQLIGISQKSFNQWTETNVDVGFSNKYLFSNSTVEGQEMVIFSKPFDFPFKISDLIYIIPIKEKYCFVNSPTEVEQELKNLNQDNFLTENCTNLKNIIRVCFSGSRNCEINVDYNAGSVDKREGTVYFDRDSLMYAGIFADKITYECQLSRLMKRVENLAQIYSKKSLMISGKGCNTNLEGDLSQLISISSNFDSSIDLFKMSELVKEIEIKNNQNSLCKL